MLRSTSLLVKSHGRDVGLEYLWNENEYGSLENRLKAMEETMTIRNLSPSACYRETNYCSL